MCRTNILSQIRAKLIGANPKTLSELLEAKVEVEADIIKYQENEKKKQNY